MYSIATSDLNHCNLTIMRILMSSYQEVSGGQNQLGLLSVSIKTPHLVNHQPPPKNSAQLFPGVVSWSSSDVENFIPS